MLDEGDLAAVRDGGLDEWNYIRPPFQRAVAGSNRINRSDSHQPASSKAEAVHEDEKEAIRGRVAQMLIAGHVPHEYKEYAKLLKTVGVEPVAELVRTRANMNNPYVAKYVRFLIEA